VAVALLAGPGCGEEARQSLVDTRRQPPINGLEVEPGSRAILLSTNLGLFRLEGEKPARRVSSVARRGDDSARVGRVLTFAAAGRSLLLGSGHPDRGGRLPPFLGLMTSEDGGRTWKVRSRAGLADLHVLRPAHGRIYALDAVLDGLLIGEAARKGWRWKELMTPGSPMLDLEVDPSDGDYLLASDKNAIYRSEDRGASWREIAKGRSARLSWPARGPVYRADADGRVSSSSDRGMTWELTSLVDGEPWKLKAVGVRHLLVALGNATILESKDGGRSWDERFSP
jgi:photosystem II stability/assembly factor-like uncharacterized protein